MAESANQHAEAVLQPTKEFPANIVAVVLQNFHDDQATLARCTLVSRAWHFIACPLLFRRMCCNATPRGSRGAKHKKRSFTDLLKFLRDNARIRRSVQDLKLGKLQLSSSHRADTVTLIISDLRDILNLTPHLRILRLSNLLLAAHETLPAPASSTHTKLEQLLLNEHTVVDHEALTGFFALFSGFSTLQVDMPQAKIESNISRKGHIKLQPTVAVPERVSGILSCSVEVFNPYPNSSDEDEDIDEDAIQERATQSFSVVNCIIHTVGSMFRSIILGPFPADFGLPFDLAPCSNLQDIVVKFDVACGLAWDETIFFTRSGLAEENLSEVVLPSIAEMLETAPDTLSKVHIVLGFEERLMAGDVDEDLFLDTLDNVIQWEPVVRMVTDHSTLENVNFTLVFHHTFRDSYPQEIMEWMDQNSLDDDIRDQFHSVFQLSVLHWNAYRALCI